jgi:hypothetical protein
MNILGLPQDALWIVFDAAELSLVEAPCVSKEYDAKIKCYQNIMLQNTMTTLSGDFQTKRMLQHLNIQRNLCPRDTLAALFRGQRDLLLHFSSRTRPLPFCPPIGHLQHAYSKNDLILTPVLARNLPSFLNVCHKAVPASQPLPQNLRELEPAVRLELLETYLSENLHHFQTIKTLDFSNCGNGWTTLCSALSPYITKLTQLEKVVLSNHSFMELPNQLSTISCVKKLDLSSTNLNSLPPELFDFSRLETLRLSNNKLQVLPSDISRLTNLKTLYLTNCYLKELPEELFSLANLQKIYLMGNPQIIENSASMASLMNMNLKLLRTV